MELTQRHYHYLVGIYQLAQSRPSVGATELAEHLGLSKPSVSRMVGVLADRGVVEKEWYGKIHLASRGVQLAEEYISAQALIQERLPRMELNLTEEQTQATVDRLALLLMQSA